MKTDTHQTELTALDVVTVQLVRERQLLYHNRLTMPEQAVEIFIALVENPDRECFVALMLDTKNRVTSVHLVSQGSLNQSIVHPRETFKSVRLGKCSGYHPGSQPSQRGCLAKQGGHRNHQPTERSWRIARHTGVRPFNSRYRIGTLYVLRLAGAFLK